RQSLQKKGKSKKEKHTPSFLPFLHGKTNANGNERASWIDELQRPPNQLHDEHHADVVSAVKKYNKRRTALPVPAESVTPSATALSLLDEQVLMLYHSSLRRPVQHHSEADSVTTPIEFSPLPVQLEREYGHESVHAATMVQKVFRGYRTRVWMNSHDGPRYQRAARLMQFLFRRIVIMHRISRRIQRKRELRATQLQAWYRGCRCRDSLWYNEARMVNDAIIRIQIRFRGFRFWRVVRALLEARRQRCCIAIQRVCRGHLGRARVKRLRHEKLRYVRALDDLSQLHRAFVRCERCNLEKCTEASLFECFMVRYIGLHDFRGATLLALDGIRMFPRSAKFHFFYSLMLQVMCEDLEVALTHLNKAIVVLHVAEHDLEQFYAAALQLRLKDAVAYLDLAVLFQSSGKLTRAETNYRHAMSCPPTDYLIPGYLHRVHMVDRLLLNYHRFTSIYLGRQSHVLAKQIALAKKGEKVKFAVVKQNHFTVIYPTDDAILSRINAVYLSDEELVAIMAEQSRRDGVDVQQEAESAGYRSLSSWRKESFRVSNRQRSYKNSLIELAAATGARKNVLVQLYQQEFQGLNVRPSELAGFSESKSRLRLPKELAERVLRELVFIDPSTVTTPDVVSPAHTSSTLHRIAVHPFIAKQRRQHQQAVQLSHAILDVQRMWRGFAVRAEIRRDQTLHRVQQRQVDQVLATLHANFLVREHRRIAATSIQRAYRGFAMRNLIVRMKRAVADIQRVFRGFRGRKRARSFRDGTCTFYMAERVFQRGVEVSGRLLLLILDKCGLSFRMFGHDIEACVTYEGFLSHQSTMNLLAYTNWTYGLTFVGREFTWQGKKARILGVTDVHPVSTMCSMACHYVAMDEVTGAFHLSLNECITAINLRSISIGADTYELCHSPNDTARVTAVVVQNITLISQRLPMATVDLKKKAPGAAILTVRPPPQLHFLHQNHTTKVATTKPQPAATTLLSGTRLIVFPVSDGLRGVTIGHKKFRKQCERHAFQFTRCRCILPIVPTPPYIQALSLALYQTPDESKSRSFY
ncbi:TPA: hypothetical protein N0F65_007200, partial [Lagenidium giganteum]